MYSTKDRGSPMIILVDRVGQQTMHHITIAPFLLTI